MVVLTALALCEIQTLAAVHLPLDRLPIQRVLQSDLVPAFDDLS